jgi:glycosyltransferase involved in cell wall biosynthesis
VGVNVASFKPKQAKEVHTGATVMFAGKLEPRKGTFLLLQAFQELAANISGVTLRIVGDGPLRAELEKETAKRGLKGRVSFIGAVNHAQMVDELEHADIFVFPSIRDTSGAIVLEAMAMMLPVICLDHQGSALMVGDDCGLKIPVGNSEETVARMAEALRRLVENPELRASMGKAGRIRATEVFDWSSKVSRISAYYETLIEDCQARHRLDS